MSLNGVAARALGWTYLEILATCHTLTGLSSLCLRMSSFVVICRDEVVDSRCRP